MTFDEHVHQIAADHHIQLNLKPDFPQDDARAHFKTRTITGHTVIDDVTYAIIMHELGHLITGVRTAAFDPQPDNMTAESLYHRISSYRAAQYQDEVTAWKWAQAHVLYWSPAMEDVKRWALSTYQRPAPPISCTFVGNTLYDVRTGTPIGGDITVTFYHEEL